MKILVTGTAGFIGFHLAQRLLQENHDVIGLDNFNEYYSVALKNARHQLLCNYKNYEGHNLDLCDADQIQQLFKHNKFDQVVHLAAQAGVRYSLDHPFAYIKANIEGFLSILEACRHHGKPRLIYASSSSVYGANTKIPFSESDRVDQPVSLYSATKKADEMMAHSYSHLYDMQTIGLRFFTVYGPWGRPDMAMWIFADRIQRGEPIPVFNYGNMRRDFTFVEDIVNGISAILSTSDLEQNEIFNLGNNKSEKLLDMIAEIEKAMGKKAKLNLLPMQPGDVPATYADITRAQQKLHFEPATPISIGVPKFIDWFKEYHGF